MAWYKTGTLSIAANSKKATGHGTRWADNKQGIGPGQMLLLPGMGSVVLYEIDRVVSNTELLLVTGPQIAVKELSYAIVTYNGGSYVDFGRELSAQLRYYQRQMDGWQHIMTGEGEVTLEAPDGTQVTLSSFKKLTADVASKVDKSALDKKADKTALDKKADKSALEKKADKTALDKKADKAELDNKADKTELENKVDKDALAGKLDKTGGSVSGPLTVQGSCNFTGQDYLVKSGIIHDKANNVRNTQGLRLQGEGAQGSDIFFWDQIGAWTAMRFHIWSGGSHGMFNFHSDGHAYSEQGGWHNSSDRRIKSDIAKIDNGLEKVEQLTGYTYTILNRNRQAGVMADELEKVLPEAVSISGDSKLNDGTVVKNVKAVAYGNVTALLIEAIKDLSAKVKAQQAEIDALKASMSTVYVAQDADSA